MHLFLFAESVQLFPDGTIFIHIALILGMIWLLNRTLYRPINRVLEARENQKGGHSLEADDILRNVETKEAQYAKEMLDARSAGYELIEKEQKKAAADRAEKFASAKAEIGEKFETGRSEIEKQTGEAHKEIGSNAEKMADKIAANILNV
jgi:F-type H+-transporting ATPase subunit b